MTGLNQDGDRRYWMNRRGFLHTAATGLAWTQLSRNLRAQPAKRRAKAPFRLLYSNDSTNLVACQSPFFRRGDSFTDAVLKASVDEAAGVDAHLLQPGLTYVPLWQSKIYPPADHFRWWKKTFPEAPIHPLGEYAMGGGDLVRVFADHCRWRGVAPFVSLRVNDYHRLEFLDAPAGTTLGSFDSLTLDQFRRAHPEYRLNANVNAANAPTKIGPTSKELFRDRDDSVLNWAIPAVRERFLGFVAEIVQGYDLAGLELDFLRHFKLFRPDQTTAAQRVAIVTEVVARTRRELDAMGGGAHRWLCVRIPALLSMHDPLGLDVAALAAAGVDMFNLSSNYFTVQQNLDLTAIRRAAPDRAIYVEMTHCTMVGDDITRGHGDNFLFRRATAAQYHTTAELCRARGADGMSLFNFAYFRESGSDPRRGPFSEPPFSTLPSLASSVFHSGLPRHSFLAPAWRAPHQRSVQLPLKIAADGRGALRFDLAARPGGWRKPGWLRIQAERPFGAARWRAELNGSRLDAVENGEVPHDPHPALQGTAETVAAWRVPFQLLQEQINTVDLALEASEASTLIFAELILP